MKKVIYAISAIALIVFGATSCQKNLVDASKTTGKLTLTASVEQPSGVDTKSYLDGTLVKWHAGDAIKVFDEDGGYTKMETQDEGTTSAVFMEVGTVEGGTKSANFDETNIKCAIYPYSAESTYGDNKISYDFPEVQTYAANSFGPGANIAVAKLTPGNNIVKFTNVCGMLKLSLKGNGVIKKITITSNNSENEKLYGSATITMDADKPILTVNSTGGEVMTLEVPNIYLYSSPTDFYISIPVGSFGNATNGGFVATINDDPDASYVTNKSENVIIRSVVRSMPTLSRTAFPVPDAYKMVQYVGGASRPLDTGIALNQLLSLSINFYLTETLELDGEGLFGKSNSTANIGLYAFPYTSKLYIENFSGKDFAIGSLTDKCCMGTHTATFDAEGVTWDGEFFQAAQSDSNLDGDTTLSLFATRKGTVCSTMFVNNIVVQKTATREVVFWGIAVERVNDGKAGFYDMISDQFLTTDGMTTLTL